MLKLINVKMKGLGDITKKVVEAGSMQKARFAHIGGNGYSLNRVTVDL
jgi:hypothetical protein